MSAVYFCFIILVSGIAQSQVIPFGNLKTQAQQNNRASGTTASPRLLFDRPNANGTSAPVTQFGSATFRYQIQSFTVTATGNYTINSTQSFNGFMILYSSSFDQASPLNNAIVANDDDVSALTSKIGPLTLNSGTQYYLVITSSVAGVTGTYSISITPPVGESAVFNGSVSTTALSYSNGPTTLITGYPPPDSMAVEIFKDAACTLKISTPSQETPGRFLGAGITVTHPTNQSSTYYVRTKNKLGVNGPCVRMTEFCHSLIVPPAPTGLTSGTAAQSFKLSPAANWDAYVDTSICGFRNFQISIDKTAGSIGAMTRQWFTPTGNSDPGIAAVFVSGQTYYINLRVTDNIGQASTVISSPGFSITHPNPISFSVTTSAVSPTLNGRPNTATPPNATTAGTWRYSVQGFTVDTTGAYTLINLEQNYDAYVVLYANSFDPNSPLTNALRANDDFVGGYSQARNSGFENVNLTAGVQYFFVTTSWFSAAFGNSIGHFFGPGLITLN